ncbi:MAG: hypothetical protein QNK11_03270 [Legionella sp.]|nr:hypothetical protein [Legionella sp.]
MDDDTKIPLFVSIITLLLGCYDLFRAIQYTLHLELSALYISKINLSTFDLANLLHLLGVFGASNYIISLMLILTAFMARRLALIMLAIIPFAYGMGILTIKLNAAEYHLAQAAWEGTVPMLIYLGICVVTFIAGIIGTLRNKSDA